MKKHIMLSFLLAGTMLLNQTTFGMKEQEKADPKTTQASASNEGKPSLTSHISTNKVTGIKNWVLAHKKPIFVGAGVVLSIATAYLIAKIYGYFPATSEEQITAAIIDEKTNIEAQIKKQKDWIEKKIRDPKAKELLKAADECANRNYCWEPTATYDPELGDPNTQLKGCSISDWRNGIFSSCYDKVIEYANGITNQKLRNRLMDAIFTNSAIYKDGYNHLAYQYNRFN